MSEEEKKGEELTEHEAPIEEEETTVTEESVSEETTTEAETVEEEPEEVEAEPETTEPAAEAEEGEEGEEEIEVVEEKVYTIPLRHAWVVTPRGKRAPRSARDVRAFVSRHMKSDEVSLSNEINAALWSRGLKKPPRKISVRAVKDKEGKVIVYPAKAA